MPFGSPTWQTSVNGQAANSDPCDILGVNEPFAIRRLTEVTGHCLEVSARAAGPFAIRCFPPFTIRRFLPLPSGRGSLSFALRYSLFSTARRSPESFPRLAASGAGPHPFFPSPEASGEGMTSHAFRHHCM